MLIPRLRAAEHRQVSGADHARREAPQDDATGYVFQHQRILNVVTADVPHE